uniref:PIF-1 n=1 Tax=Venturia canescens TaxID=32260 RepID=A0A0U1ZKY0_9HYME|nr:PIF-1 [Venturia canescens]
MDPNTWLAFVIVILALALAIVTVWLGEIKMTEIKFTEPEIKKFSVDVHWDPYPTEFSVENARNCNAKNLQKCKIDNLDDLLGCKELAVSCRHFSKDTAYYEHGEKFIIPRNKSENDGWVLAITDLAAACNPYHGDYVLVAANDNSTEYMLVCQCKNPGYIGNDDILGACTGLRICNGKVDNINQELKDINCVCKLGQYSHRYDDDGVPVCKTLTVEKANEMYPRGWDHIVPFGSKTLLSIDYFHKDIQDNVKVQKLLNPCEYVLNNPEISNPGSNFNERINSCFFKDYGIPLRIGIFPETDDSGLEPLDAVLPSLRYEELRIIDGLTPEAAKSDNYDRSESGEPGKSITPATRRINMKVIIDEYKETPIYVTLPKNIGFDSHSQLFMSMRDQIVGGRCYGQWPSYSCNFVNYYSQRRYGIPMAGYRDPPGTFFWGTDDWINAESMISYGVTTEGDGLRINKKWFLFKKDHRPYGMQYCHKSKKCLNGMLSLKDSDHANIHWDAMGGP